MIGEIIKKRRSIRQFDSREIPLQTLYNCLNTAKFAPSGKNRQPWKVKIVTEEEKNDLISIVQNMYEGDILPGSLQLSLNAIKAADKLLIVFNAYSYHEENYPRNRLLMDVQSIGAFIQNLLLLLTEEGISSLWLNDLYYAKEILEDYLVQGEYELIAGVAIGYASIEQPLCL